MTAALDHAEYLLPAIPSSHANHYAHHSSSAAAAAAGGVKKKRSEYTRRACHYCAIKKVKCDGQDPCATCVRVGTECDYTRRDRERAERKAKAAASELLNPPIPPSKPLGSRKRSASTATVDENSSSYLNNSASPASRNKAPFIPPKPIPSAFSNPVTSVGATSYTSKHRTMAPPTSRQLSQLSSAAIRAASSARSQDSMLPPPSKRINVSVEENTAKNTIMGDVDGFGAMDSPNPMPIRDFDPFALFTTLSEVENVVFDSFPVINTGGGASSTLQTGASPEQPQTAALPRHHYQCIHEYPSIQLYPIPPILECPYQPFTTDTSLKCHLLDCYFTFAHSQTPILHKASFLQGSSGTFSYLGGYACEASAPPQPWENECPLLLYSLFAMGAIYSDDPYVCINPTRRYYNGDHYYYMALAYLDNLSSHLTVRGLFGLLILTRYACYSGKEKRSELINLLFSLAGELPFDSICSVNLEDVKSSEMTRGFSSSVVVAEEARRLFWVIYQKDLLLNCPSAILWVHKAAEKGVLLTDIIPLPRITNDAWISLTVIQLDANGNIAGGNINTSSAGQGVIESTPSSPKSLPAALVSPTDFSVEKHDENSSFEMLFSFVRQGLASVSADNTSVWGYGVLISEIVNLVTQVQQVLITPADSTVPSLCETRDANKCLDAWYSSLPSQYRNVFYQPRPVDHRWSRQDWEYVHLHLLYHYAQFSLYLPLLLQLFVAGKLHIDALMDSKSSWIVSVLDGSGDDNLNEEVVNSFPNIVPPKSKSSKVRANQIKANQIQLQQYYWSKVLWSARQVHVLATLMLRFNEDGFGLHSSIPAQETFFMAGLVSVFEAMITSDLSSPFLPESLTLVLQRIGTYIGDGSVPLLPPTPPPSVISDSTPISSPRPYPHQQYECDSIASTAIDILADDISCTSNTSHRDIYMGSPIAQLGYPPPPCHAAPSDSSSHAGSSLCYEAELLVLYRLLCCKWTRLLEERSG